MTEKPSILVTGGSGFIGKHFIEAVKDDFIIYAVGRRSRIEAEIPFHPNIHWIRADIGDEQSVQRFMAEIQAQGGIDYVLHMAGYYDFTYKEHPEYTRTNVYGTRHILEHARKLNPKRFLFTSSLTVNEFPAKGTKLTEASLPDANFPYARSKIKAEEFVASYSQFFPCITIRSAAIFSDWCEYEPLYNFLSVWLSQRWNCRILGGKGDSAIPFLHINDMISFIVTILDQSQSLPQHSVYLASPNDCTSHLDLYTLACRYFFGAALPAHHIPKPLAFLGVSLLNVFGLVRKKRPFERPWMMKYVDRRMPVDAALTRKMLNWTPKPRYHVKRRLLFLIENMKSYHFEWKRRNELAYYHRISDRPNFQIYKTMVKLREIIIENVVQEMLSPEHTHFFQTYQTLPPGELKQRVERMVQLLETAIRLGDRMHILKYTRTLAQERFEEGFYHDEVIYAINCIGDRTVEALLAQSELKNWEQRIYDEVLLTIQLVTDEFEESFEQLIRNNNSEQWS